ncbi:hypothetical protein CDCA_CDCA11G3104 [Cyanidium caldarium]|uniref:E2 ubiquitin-conjugating enzyme n=1 Tax=Cyanidium caldarium TaxID=2771 RepID=A0AAV9IY98_CYACA|nr:hypothetical protein CDCA_CDCA11G3104 [Cyanidium caldarium]
MNTGSVEQIRVKRLAREMESLQRSPPPYVSVWLACSDGGNEAEHGACQLDRWEAAIRGAPGTPYEGGVFRLEVQVPPRYPFEPPQVRFRTPIYHPNIDASGRICLDALSMPPRGAWRPSANLGTVLAAVQQLMGEPNADDGLVAEISEEYRRNRVQFERTAREWTRQHALGA